MGEELKEPEEIMACPFCDSVMSKVSSLPVRGYTEEVWKCGQCGFVATFHK